MKNRNQTPHNLEEAEDQFGIERVYKHTRRKPEHKNRKGRTPTMVAKYCADCGKRGYQSEEAARIIIGRMIANRTLSGPYTFCFRPYLCVHGWWHTGHDPKSRRLLQEHTARKSNVFHSSPALATL